MRVELGTGQLAAVRLGRLGEAAVAGQVSGRADERGEIPVGRENAAVQVAAPVAAGRPLRVGDPLLPDVVALLLGFSQQGGGTGSAGGDVGAEVVAQRGLGAELFHSVLHSLCTLGGGLLGGAAAGGGAAGLVVPDGDRGVGVADGALQPGQAVRPGGVANQVGEQR